MVKGCLNRLSRKIGYASGLCHVESIAMHLESSGAQAVLDNGAFDFNKDICIQVLPTVYMLCHFRWEVYTSYVTNNESFTSGSRYKVMDNALYAYDFHTVLCTCGKIKVDKQKIAILSVRFRIMMNTFVRGTDSIYKMIISCKLVSRFNLNLYDVS